MASSSRSLVVTFRQMPIRAAGLPSPSSSHFSLDVQDLRATVGQQRTQHDIAHAVEEGCAGADGLADHFGDMDPARRWADARAASRCPASRRDRRPSAHTGPATRNGRVGRGRSANSRCAPRVPPARRRRAGAPRSVPQMRYCGIRRWLPPDGPASFYGADITAASVNNAFVQSGQKHERKLKTAGFQRLRARQPISRRQKAPSQWIRSAAA